MGVACTYTVIITDRKKFYGTGSTSIESGPLSLRMTILDE